MQVRILGSAAGGGSPQWNCHCSVCVAVRTGAPGTLPRMQSSLAVRATDRSPWLLVNASPDVHRQLELLDPTAPADAIRHTPIGGVLLTDAEIDHCAGLLLLRESTAPLTLYATEPAHRALQTDWPVLRMLDAWCGIDWHELVADDPSHAVSHDGIAIETFTTGHDAPRYQSFPGGPGTSVGVTFRTADHAITYCPTLERWSDALAARFAASDVVLVDGTFWSDDELARHGAPEPRTATQMGHLPLDGSDGSAVRLAQLDTRVVLVHINNSNPILLEHGPERVRLTELGITVGYDGMEVHA